MTTMVEIGG